MRSIVQISIVTGANRGFGKTIASSLCKLNTVTVDSEESLLYNLLILVIRDKNNIENVLKEYKELALTEKTRLHVIGGAELSDINSLGEVMSDIEKQLKEYIASEIFELCNEKRLVLFNNAGSLGDISLKATELQPLDVNEYTCINFTSFSYFCQFYYLKEGVNSSEFKKWQGLGSFDQSIIANTSSLAAIKPFVCTSLYCSIKAARDMLLRVIALEDTSIRTLNYSPGPMDNDMQKQMRTQHADPNTRNYFQTLFEEKTLVRMEDSAAKLLSLVLRNQFDSGDHIDYFDYEQKIPVGGGYPTQAKE